LNFLALSKELRKRNTEDKEMQSLDVIKKYLELYDSLSGAKAFFSELGYPAIDPLPLDLHKLPPAAKEIASSLHQIVHIGNSSEFRIFHVELNQPRFRRTDIRRFLEAFYRHYPQGENLFVFSLKETYDKLIFVSPKRLLLRDKEKLRLWLRILQLRRSEPYRTDLEVLERIQAHQIQDPEKIWKCHEEAFCVHRVTEKFYEDYCEIFRQIRSYLLETHEDNTPEWASDYTHQLLNRIMFIYFIARKGWLLGPDGQPDRDFMKHFWNAYKDSKNKDLFQTEWLNILFFEAFNNKWQNRHEYLRRFPKWLCNALSQAPFLNGGLYISRPDLDDYLKRHIPDSFFELLFERWIDGSFPGFFERYNFTVLEKGRLDEEVAVDPEILGMVYERLVNVTFETQNLDLRGSAGIFYTPRIEIDLMCRLALADWLTNDIGRRYKDVICQWVFALTEEEKQEADNYIDKEHLWERLNKLIHRVRVCDPACGSGSFLVDMMLILDDLQARCASRMNSKETSYERRKRIIRDQLYGVDIMEWAVRVAELRLWLQLVVETEFDPHEIHLGTGPLLPNLNFKIRTGDSLLQTIGHLDFSRFRRSELRLSGHLKYRLEKLKEKKLRFFSGEDKKLNESDIRKEELILFKEILREKINFLKETQFQIQQNLSDITPAKYEEDLKDQIRIQKEELEEQIKTLNSTLESLSSSQQVPFVWDIAFVEVFEDENRGFDIVIGNPPYVRQERIQDYLNRFERSEYIRRLNESLRAIYPDFMKKKGRISGRADYYVYFYFHGLSLLADKGSFCFITSNSWLDVEFGKDLQEFFLRYGHIKMIIDNRAKRSFSQADINTVIVLAASPHRKRALSIKEMKDRLVRFVSFRVPFEQVISPVIFLEVEDDRLYEPLAGFKILNRKEFRSVLLDQWTLYKEGLPAEEEKSGLLPQEKKQKYEANKWGGKYLRAPDIYYTILEKGKGKLVRLGEIAEVRRGFTTGANEFFYLKPIDKTVKEVVEIQKEDPKQPIRVKNEAGWKGEIEAAWLHPVIKSPREIKTIQVHLEDLNYLVFMPPNDIREAIEHRYEAPLNFYPYASSYISWGEKAKFICGHKNCNYRGIIENCPRHGPDKIEIDAFNDRPTCASRLYWWDVGRQERQNFIILRFRDQRNWTPILKDEIFVGDVVFVGKYNSPQDAEILNAILNSTLFIFFTEIFGRVNLAEGLLTTYGPDIFRILVPSPQVFSEKHRYLIKNFFSELSEFPVLNIFEQFGFASSRPAQRFILEDSYKDIDNESITLDQIKNASPVRFEIDRIIFDVLGLNQEEHLNIYKAVVQLIKDRMIKARSV
jgi:hypothetical protein